jgi:hypothetical protein
MWTTAYSPVCHFSDEERVSFCSVAQHSHAHRLRRTSHRRYASCAMPTMGVAPCCGSRRAVAWPLKAWCSIHRSLSHCQKRFMLGSSLAEWELWLLPELSCHSRLSPS